MVSSLTSGITRIINTIIIPMNDLINAGTSIILNKLGAIGGLVNTAVNTATSLITEGIPNALSAIAGFGAEQIGAITDVLTSGVSLLEQATTSAVISSVNELANAAADISSEEVSTIIDNNLNTSIQQQAQTLREELSLTIDAVAPSGADTGDILNRSATVLNNAVEAARTESLTKVVDEVVDMERQLGGWDNVRQAMERASSNIQEMAFQAIHQEQNAYLSKLLDSRGYDKLPTNDQLESTATAQELAMRTKEALYDETVYL